MPLYFEDIEEGFKYSTPKRTVFEADIVNFVALSGLYEESTGAATSCWQPVTALPFLLTPVGHKR